MAIEVRRLGHALGAQVTGLDLRSTLGDGEVAAIRRALLDHTLLCFPGANLSLAELVAFCGRFCELDDFAWKPENTRFNLVDYPNVQLLANKPVEVKNQTVRPVMADEWHSDNCYMERPASLIFLNATAIPETGGDTLFADMHLAYETLSPAFRRLVDALEVVHDGSIAVDFQRQSSEAQAARRERYPPIIHPLVRVHPETRRPSLYIGNRIRKFVGMTEEESHPLRDFLNRHATRYEFTYRHRWTLHDLLMWYNPSLLHYAAQDYDHGQLRVLQRCNSLVPREGRYYDAQRDDRQAVTA